LTQAWPTRGSSSSPPSLPSESPALAKRREGLEEGEDGRGEGWSRKEKAEESGLSG